MKRFVLGAVVGLALAGGVAYASIPDSGGVIHACMLKNIGTIRLIDPAFGQKCNATFETAVDWNQKGARGPTGPSGTGARGPTGPKGDAGTNGSGGATGTRGPTGADGAKGASGTRGPSGPAGPSGADGPKGTTGARGPTGPAGGGSGGAISGYEKHTANLANFQAVYVFPGSSPSVTISCSTGKKVLTGGILAHDPQLVLIRSEPTSQMTGWFVQILSTNTTGLLLPGPDAFAICADA
jgi:hypothetical protein